MEKQELCEWMYKALQCALTSKNIKSGFRKAGIWPLDHSATKEAIHPSIGFAMEEGGDYDNDHNLGSSITLMGRGALEIPTQASYPGRDRGWRSPPTKDLEKADRSARCHGLSR